MSEYDLRGYRLVLSGNEAKVYEGSRLVHEAVGSVVGQPSAHVQCIHWIKKHPVGTVKLEPPKPKPKPKPNKET